MKHLERDELVELIDRPDRDATVAHLASCDECRDELRQLRLVVARVAEVDAPEPSPLFWEHFSARVRNAVAAEQPGGQPALETVRSRWRHAFTAALVALAALLVLVIVTKRPTMVVPTTPENVSTTLEPFDGSTRGIDDPTLDIVANLGRDVDWDDLHDGGVMVHTGLLDRAVNGLSEGERDELGRLLKQELSGGVD